MHDLHILKHKIHFVANWDGFHDNETGIFGYTWSIGHFPCDDMIHEHHDPHAHLFDESEWTHTGSVHPLPPPYTILDGKQIILFVHHFRRVVVSATMALPI